MDGTAAQAPNQGAPAQGAPANGTRANTASTNGTAAHGTRAAGAPIAVVIDLPIAKGMIASRPNLTQEHFSRILHEVSAAGLIEVQGPRILVPDLERLRAHAPNVEVVRIEEAGHYVQNEAPERVNDELLRWLAAQKPP